MSKVFIAFQANEESRPLVDAIVADNPEAQVVYSPGLVKIDAPNRLVVKRETIEEIIGRKYDLQELQNILRHKVKGGGYRSFRHQLRCSDECVHHLEQHL